MGLRLLKRWTVGVVAVIATIAIAKMIDIELDWPTNLAIIAFVPVYATLNAVCGSILRLIFLPVSCLTFGLSNLLINAAVFYVAGIATDAQMSVVGAVFGSVCVTIISAPINWLAGTDKKEK